MYKKRFAAFGVTLLIFLSAVQSIGGYDFDTSITPTGGSGPDYPYPGVGDWLITGDTSVWDETIVVKGNLIVTDTGRLTLMNCTLKINCTFEGQYKVRVNRTGEFYVYDSTITPYNTAYKYRFEVYGRLWTNRSTIEYLWGQQDTPMYQGGVQIYGAGVDVWLNDTKIWKSWANGIHAVNALGINITNCNITDNARIEIYLQNCQYVNISHTNVTDYTDLRPGDGIHIVDSSNVDIYASMVASNPAAVMDLDNVSYSMVRYCNLGLGADGINPVGVIVRDCNTTLKIAWNNVSDVDGSGLIFSTSPSSPIVEYNKISDNGGAGIAIFSSALGSHLYFYNNTIGNNTSQGVDIHDSNATIINNTFWGDNIAMWNSYAWIEDCFIKGGDAIWGNGSSPFIVNTTIVTGGFGRSFNIENDSHPFALNCTVDYWDHMIVEDTSNVTVQNYLHVRVVDSDAVTPIPNAWVNVTDNGILIFSGLSDTNGEVRWITVTNRTYLRDFWTEVHPFTNISYNETVVQVEKGTLEFYDNPRTVGMDTNHWEIFQVDPEFNISLQEGWNLVSLPLEQSNESIDQVLSSINGKWDYIQTYDAINSIWQSNATFKPDQLNDFKTLNHKVGFWINITEPNVNLTVRGYIPSSTSINLYAGWNLVGYPSLNTETVANALWGTGADRVEVFNATAPYRIKEVGANYLMKPGEGYWVHVVADSVWVVDW